MTDSLIFNLIIGMLFVSGIGMAGLGLYTRRYADRVPAATPYVLLTFCAAGWAILYALDLLTQSLQLRVFFHNLRFLFLPYISVLALWLVIAYIKRPEWLRLKWALLVLVIPVTASVLALTSPFHQMFRYNFSIVTSGPVPFLAYTESAFFTVYSLYSLFLLILAELILVAESRKQGTLFEMQTLLLFLAPAIPILFTYGFEAGLTPLPGINLATVFFWIPAALYAIAIFHYGFLDILPVARSRLIEALGRPVLVLDTESHIVYLNPAAGSFFSIPPPSAIGREIDAIVPDWPDFLSLCREGTAQTKDLVRTGKGGMQYYVGSAEPLLSPDGAIAGHLIFLQDVTDLKRTEQALRESEEKYRNIIENMQDMFYRTDLAGRITMISPSGVKLAGYDSPDQVIGMDASTFYANPSERERFLEVLHREGSVYAYPSVLRDRRGSLRHVTTSSHFFRDAGGSVLGIEGIIHDISDQWRAEEALRVANRKLNLFSTITRNDIRNQLIALMAFLDLSIDASGNPSEITELREFLKKNQKIADTITQQITFTAEYEDLGVRAPTWQNVHATIDKAVEERLPGKIHIDKETPGLEIFADPLVEKVFSSLLDNALQYGGDKLTTIRITAHHAGSSLVLVFEDDGVGIAPQDKAALFSKESGKNTGPGLYISREILSITGISIDETGVFRNGARFEITIPEGGFRYKEDLESRNTGTGHECRYDTAGCRR
ncbi:MAG: histidine kinase N-terminal 7TM domain-containing protein [Methanoregulaceae archaeon]